MSLTSICSSLALALVDRSVHYDLLKKVTRLRSLRRGVGLKMTISPRHPDSYFADKQWRHITNWKSELRPWYDRAARMLGVTNNPFFSPPYKSMKDAAIEMGVGHTFKLAPLEFILVKDLAKHHRIPFLAAKARLEPVVCSAVLACQDAETMQKTRYLKSLQRSKNWGARPSCSSGFPLRAGSVPDFEQSSCTYRCAWSSKTIRIVIPRWYHFCMAMTLRLSEEQSSALKKVATSQPLFSRRK